MSRTQGFINRHSSILVGILVIPAFFFLGTRFSPEKDVLVRSHIPFVTSFRGELENILPLEELNSLQTIDSLAKAYQDSIPTLELLQKVLFQDLNIQFDPDANNAENTWPSGVLKNRRASCLGTSLIALLLAEKWNLPIQGVSAPGHFFLRYHDSVNFEPNRKGYRHPDSYYRTQYNIGPNHSVYLRNLTTQEVLGVILYMQAYLLQNAPLNTSSRSKRKQTMSLLHQSLRYFPDFPEATGNLALLHVQNGSLDSASQLLKKLQVIVPEDSLVRQNLRTIQQIQAKEQIPVMD